LRSKWCLSASDNAQAPASNSAVTLNKATNSYMEATSQMTAEAVEDTDACKVKLLTKPKSTESGNLGMMKFEHDDSNCNEENDAISLSDENDLDILLDVAPPLFVVIERFAKDPQETKIPSRAASKVTKIIPCNDRIQRSIVTLIDHGVSDKLLS